MLAALPLGSGRPIADPFEPTAELVRCSSCAGARSTPPTARAGTRARGLRSLLRGRLSHA